MRILRRIVRFGSRYYLPVLALPLMAGLLGYWVIVVVDPYDLRTTGLSPRLADHRYPDREWPRLIRALTSEPHELVMLGGSTTMAISPAMMQSAFPELRNPVNLSYIAPRSLDLADVLKRVGAMKGLRHVILVMDFTLLERRPHRSAFGEDMVNLSKTSWSRGGDFSLATALASVHRLVFGTYDLPAWSRLEVPEFMLGARPVTGSSASMARFRQSVLRHREDVFAKSGLSCEQIPFLRNVLAPFLSELGSKGVAIDLVFPPIPYILHYDWIDHGPPGNIMLPGPVFDQFLVFKRCVVETRNRSGSSAARVIALDVNDNLSGDLNQYMDNAHLLNAEAYVTTLRMIANGEQTLSSDTMAEYEIGLRAKVERAGIGMTSR